MTGDLRFRAGGPEDIAAIKELYPKAFPEEDLVPLVTSLLAEKSGIASFVATQGENVVGHIAFTTCSIAKQAHKIALLGPLAVHPDHQRQGVGGNLIRMGIESERESGKGLICVLGDPNYYQKFGFTPERSVDPPYPIPVEWRDAWQSVGSNGDQSAVSGQLSVPAPWQRAALWGP